MEKQKKHPEGFGSNPPVAPDEFTNTSTKTVDVIHGIYSHSLPLAGMTVKQIRTELSDRMNIDPQATTVVDGNEVDENYTVKQGETINFVKVAGEKG